MSRRRGKVPGVRTAFAILWIWNCAGLAVGCDRAPRQAGDASTDSATVPQDATDSPPSAGSDSAKATDHCVIPLREPPPPEVSSLESCPDDPDGRPQMPLGQIEFPDAPHAPPLKVELALSTEARQHGLMYRSELSDEEGMLFSWTTEEQRRFWMKNTCLALDMLFIDKAGNIAGILENVPPWNESSRTIACPVAHVLEVRAGWTRAYGVQPGQRVLVTAAQDP